MRYNDDREVLLTGRGWRTNSRCLPSTPRRNAKCIVPVRRFHEGGPEDDTGMGQKVQESSVGLSWSGEWTTPHVSLHDVWTYRAGAPDSGTVAQVHHQRRRRETCVPKESSAVTSAHREVHFRLSTTECPVLQWQPFLRSHPSEERRKGPCLTSFNVTCPVFCKMVLFVD